MKSRLAYTGKNIFWGYVSSGLTVLLSFITRTIFIYTIGVEFLGINGLFASILGVLSLTELGVGAAMNYSLYKPVADSDVEKVKALMLIYKKAYQWIAGIITILGFLILPFLNYLVEGAEGIEYVKIYYLIFLFNTVSSYFVSYKYSLVNAEQKSYLVTNITMVFNLVMNGIQIISLFVFQNYLGYLLVQALFQLLQKIYTSYYIDKRYPYLKEKEVQPLEEKEWSRIVRDVKALLFHKIGEISVNQTDNIIISAFINVITVGLVSNYTLIISTVNTFVNIIFNGMIGSLGNLFATSDKEKQYSVFKVIDFVDFWIFSFSSVTIFALVQPFISLMWGTQCLIGLPAVFLIVLNNYMVGQRISINNIKVAGGLFEQDKYLAIIQSLVNLAVSVVCARKLGLIGVYMGTIVSGLIPSLIRPYVVFKYLLKRSSKQYYLRFFLRMLITMCLAIGCLRINNIILEELTWGSFVLATILTILVPNVILLLLNAKSEEFKYLWNIVKQLLSKAKRGKRNGATS